MGESIPFYDTDMRVNNNRRMILPRPGRKTFRNVEVSYSKAGQFLDEFLSSSNIHGLSHLAVKDKHFLEYLLWMVILAGAITGLSYMGMNAWRRYQDYPTVISMEKDYKHWNVSFATLTLCSKVRIDGNKLRAIADRHQVRDVNGFVEFFTKLSTANYADFNNLPDYREIEPENFIKILNEARFEFTYELSNSHNVEQNPVVIVTENGLCHALNTDIGVYFNPENFNRKIPVKRGNENLIFGNSFDGDTFIQTMLLNSGFNVTVTGPYDLPDVSVRRMESQMYQYFIIELEVLPIISTERVRSLTPRQRKCRYYDESNLELSDVYAYSMCRMQCRADLAYQLCECTPYFYRKSGSRRYCDAEGMKCLGKHARFLTILRDPLTDRKIHCECLPLCNDVHYLIAQEMLMEWPTFTHFKSSLASFPRTRLKREVIFGFDDFLVSIGGSAGLLLGCSVLSFIEIIYFFTIRLLFYLWK